MGSILDRQLILVVGKGGVGRSTVAASLGAAIARRGRKVLLYEANANDRFGRFFGVAPAGPAISELRPGLSAVNTTPADALHEYGVMVLKFERVYRMIFENRVSRSFLRAIPGLDDYSLLGKAWYHTTEQSRGRPRFDTLIFDMPASGHALSMLRIPSVILETVPEGPLTRDARTIRRLLEDSTRTAIVMVTLAEEMPANEAREFQATLTDKLGLRVAQLIVNQVFPDRIPAGGPASRTVDALLADTGAQRGESDLAALAAHADLCRHRRALNQRYLRQLAETIAAPQIELPQLFVPSIGLPQIEALSATLEQRLGSM